uniref:C-type lectin domain-containing protein n=1 Tax=Terrapene triunguis TaxID=2587831 RepID=A0A674J224_9SAUR
MSMITAVSTLFPEHQYNTHTHPVTVEALTCYYPCALPGAAIKPDMAALRASAASCCPEGWIASQGKCYYYSEAEGNWKSGQNYCASHGASLAANSSLEALKTTMHHKGPSNHWVGLRREPGQPWRWGTGLNDLSRSFPVRGAGLCAYLDDGVVNSAGCDTERKWACSKPD